LEIHCWLISSRAFSVFFTDFLCGRIAQVENVSTAMIVNIFSLECVVSIHDLQKDNTWGKSQARGQTTMQGGSDYFHQVEIFHMAPIKGKRTMIQGVNSAERDVAYCCSLTRPTYSIENGHFKH
jgi:predicted amino acid-binding ACT domain protein